MSNIPLPFQKKFVVEDIRSKNMFNKNCVKQNWYLSYADGKTETWDSNMAYMIDFIEVESNQQYTMSYLEEATIFNIYEYDANKNFIQHQQQNNDKNSFTITTSVTTRFIRLSCGKACIEKMQFEEGTQATEYCKHFEFKQREKVKIINNFGNLGNAINKALDLGEEIQNIVRIDGLARNGNTIIPFPNSEIKVFIEGTWLNITTTTDMSNYSTTVRIYYEE